MATKYNIKKIGARLAARRAVIGLSLAAVAKKTGISGSTLWQMEHGGSCLSAIAFAKVCDVYEVSADKMLGRKP